MDPSSSRGRLGVRLRVGRTDRRFPDCSSFTTMHEKAETMGEGTEKLVEAQNANGCCHRVLAKLGGIVVDNAGGPVIQHWDSCLLGEDGFLLHPNYR